MTSSRAVEDCRMLSCIVYDTSSGSWYTGTPAGPPSYTPVGVYPGHADDPRSGKGIRVAPSPTHLTLAVARCRDAGLPRYTPVGVYPNHAADPRIGQGIRSASSPTLMTLAVARAAESGAPSTHQWVCTPATSVTPAVAGAST